MPRDQSSDNRRQPSVFARVRNRVCPAGTHRVGQHRTSGQTLPLSLKSTSPPICPLPGERSGTFRDHRGGAGIAGHHSAVTIPACATIEEPQCRHPIPQATGGADWRTHYPYSFQCHREILWNGQLIRFPRWYLLNISKANSRINHPTCPQGKERRATILKVGQMVCLLCLECSVWGERWSGSSLSRQCQLWHLFKNSLISTTVLSSRLGLRK